MYPEFTALQTRHSNEIESVWGRVREWNEEKGRLEREKKGGVRVERESE